MIKRKTKNIALLEMEKRKRELKLKKKLELMAVAPERSSKLLHNFSLPYLKWGSQKFLRCMKISSDSDHRSSLPDSKFHEFAIETFDNQSNVIPDYSAVRDRRNAMADFKAGGEDDSASAAAVRPWNLRTRRAACKAPHEEKKKKTELSSSPFSCEKEKPIELPKISISLSKQEVEEDFAAMVGTRPPRRPKKRPKIVQKHLDSIFPGLCLTEVTVDSYRVRDNPDS